MWLCKSIEGSKVKLPLLGGSSAWDAVSNAVEREVEVVVGYYKVCLMSPSCMCPVLPCRSLLGFFLPGAPLIV